eukprot:GHVT01094834.1.p1 GENE.GHVT01094834.1~~GHVT01094834.1.p1  ORF type:complete len:708 (-),score=121.37 GHVT01094834.1:1458-3581(-)
MVPRGYGQSSGERQDVICHSTEDLRYALDRALTRAKRNGRSFGRLLAPHSKEKDCKNGEAQETIRRADKRIRDDRQPGETNILSPLSSSKAAPNGEDARLGLASGLPLEVAAEEAGDLLLSLPFTRVSVLKAPPESSKSQPGLPYGILMLEIKAPILKTLQQLCASHGCVFPGREQLWPKDVGRAALRVRASFGPEPNSASSKLRSSFINFFEAIDPDQLPSEKSAGAADGEAPPEPLARDGGDWPGGAPPALAESSSGTVPPALTGQICSWPPLPPAVSLDHFSPAIYAPLLQVPSGVPALRFSADENDVFAALRPWVVPGLTQVSALVHFSHVATYKDDSFIIIYLRELYVHRQSRRPPHADGVATNPTSCGLAETFGGPPLPAGQDARTAPQNSSPTDASKFAEQLTLSPEEIAMMLHDEQLVFPSHPLLPHPPRGHGDFNAKPVDEIRSGDIVVIERRHLDAHSGPSCDQTKALLDRAICELEQEEIERDAESTPTAEPILLQTNEMQAGVSSPTSYFSSPNSPASSFHSPSSLSPSSHSSPSNKIAPTAMPGAHASLSCLSSYSSSSSSSASPPSSSSFSPSGPLLESSSVGSGPVRRASASPPRAAPCVAGEVIDVYGALDGTRVADVMLFGRKQTGRKRGPNRAALRRSTTPTLTTSYLPSILQQLSTNPFNSFTSFVNDADTLATPPSVHTLASICLYQ